MKQYAVDKPLPGPDAFMRILLDVRDAGKRTEEVPPGMYRFVTIFNNSRMDFTVYRGNVADSLQIIGSCPAYTLITFPFDGHVSNLLIEWIGPSGTTERCIVFLAAENFSLVGQFRHPQAITAGVEERVLVSRQASVGNLLQAASRILINAMFFINNDGTEARITLAHHIGATPHLLLPNISIPGNNAGSLSQVVLDAGQSLNISAFTGNITILGYGRGV
ncbi:MAG TPA: hypothetical protein VLH15_04335 [Dehalococcoidales bacterium]|nr:hypothetical protein [Dehalococcoidales bacterium]